MNNSKQTIDNYQNTELILKLAKDGHVTSESLVFTALVEQLKRIADILDNIEHEILYQLRK